MNLCHSDPDIKLIPCDHLFMAHYDPYLNIGHCDLDLNMGHCGLDLNICHCITDVEICHPGQTLQILRVPDQPQMKSGSN